MKPWGRDFWNEHDLGDLEYKTGKLRGGQEIGGRAHPPGRAPGLLGPSRLPRPTSFAYISLRILKTLNKKIDRKFRRRKPL